jgi:hypothetical protein
VNPVQNPCFFGDFFQIKKIKNLFRRHRPRKKLSHFDQILHPRKRKPADTHTSDLTNLLKSLSTQPQFRTRVLAQAKNGDEQFWK